MKFLRQIASTPKVSTETSVQLQEMFDKGWITTVKEVEDTHFDQAKSSQNILF